jgi:hypothetical protein
MSKWIGQGVERSGRGLIYGTTPSFHVTYWGETRKILVRIPGLRVEMLTWDLPNTKQEILLKPMSTFITKYTGAFFNNSSFPLKVIILIHWHAILFYVYLLKMYIQNLFKVFVNSVWKLLRNIYTSLIMLIMMIMSRGSGYVSELRPQTGLLFSPQVMYEHGKSWWNDIYRRN